MTAREFRSCYIAYVYLVTRSSSVFTGAIDKIERVYEGTNDNSIERNIPIDPHLTVAFGNIRQFRKGHWEIPEMDVSLDCTLPLS